MRFGLNGYHNPEVLAEIAAKGFNLLRIGLHMGDTPASVVEAVRASGFQALVIVRDAGQVRELGSLLAGADVELWNEPDGAVDGKIAPSDYAARVPDFVAAATEVGATPWIAAVSNLHRAGLAWLKQMFASLPPGIDCGVTIHRYPAGRSWDTPHEGFGSRDEEIAALREIIGGRRWACSEFGYHTASQIRTRLLPRNFPGNEWRWTDEEAATHVRQEWRFWAEHGAEFAVLYQIIDGQTDTREDRFGIRRLDGSYKPVADTLSA